ncbi:zygote arrest protein 2.L-like isoform X3 [Syngnathus typhle]|uniref:zygote arrest protein 2.L-like isoform X3 n=1 Tax=Syngnathus typhle TaxID=161592 RepID=UPI002A6B3D8B|nr:zygote arrest protein 2.L-like isoform X3 [Syngnathus typhle]
MEGFPTTFPPPYGVVCAPAASPIPTPGSVCWPKREARFVTPHGVNYLELCKAILGQAWPAPAARTRDCGVQVNAKVDKTVQCSLGPKTLLGSGERGEEEEDRDSSDKTPSVSQLRFFTRPVSIYSPVLERGFHTELAEEEARDEEKEHEQEGSKHPEQVHKATVHRANRGSNLQFLDQRYGFFHCKKCNIRWESAYVWCISGTNKVYYKQLCRKCQVGFNPYRVESIICKGCSETCCSCEKKQRHINMTRPHRQDLCCRCRGTKLSCDATYSFKYIV